MKFLYFMIRASREAVGFSVAAGVMSGAANIMLIALINQALRGRRSAIVSIWVFVGLCAVALVTKIVSELILVRLAQETTYNLRIQLWRQVLSVPLRKHEELGRHRILTALTSDVFTVTNFITYVPNLIMSAAMVFGCLYYLYLLSWNVFFLVLGFMVLGIVTYQIPVLKARKYFRLVRQGQDALFKQFRGLTEGIKELKLHYLRRETYSQMFSQTAQEQKRDSVTAGSIFIIAASWGQILFLVIIGLIVFLLPKMGNYELEVLTGAALTLLFMKPPLEALLGVVPSLGSASVAVAAIQDLGISLLESSEPEQGLPITEMTDWRSIELQGVMHQYKGEKEGDDFTLGPISLTLRPAETVFITGGNGSGKTTLAKLLAGLYTPEDGKIFMDGQPIGDDNREQYRQYFSAIFSDFYLFEGLHGIDEQDIDQRSRNYLTQLHLDSKVEVKDGLLSTTELSQGQRKRLALLTAYLEDRPIYIFDEWAADQDSFFRDVFYNQILRDLKGRRKTLLVISHDDRYYHLADRLIKLDYGKIESINSQSVALTSAEQGAD
jgi:putative ATP-binding cassette transporter